MDEVRGLCGWVAAVLAVEWHGDPETAAAMRRRAAEDTESFTWKKLFKGEDSVANRLIRFTPFRGLRVPLGGRPGPLIADHLLAAPSGIFIVRGATHCCAVDAAAGLVADGHTEAPLSAATLRATIGAAAELMKIVPKMPSGGKGKRRRRH